MTECFRYVAADAAGKRVRGRVGGSDEHEAFRRLVEGGLTPIQVRPAIDLKGRMTASRGISRAAIAAMTRELSVLVEARIPLSQGLEAMARNERNAALAALITDIAAHVEAGEKLSDAIDRHAHVLGHVYIATMRAAEASGMLREVTEHLADMLEAEVALRQQLKRAATYPVVVLSIVGLALCVILGFVVPRFAKTYTAAGVTLPLATRIVQGAGASMQEWWWVYLGVIAAIVVIIAQVWSTPKGRLKLEELLSHVPYFSSLLVAVSTSRFCRVLSISSGAGIELIESIELSARSSGSYRQAEEAKSLAGRLRGGASLSEVMQECVTLPPFARRLLSACKDANEVARSSDIIARHFDREASHLSASLSSVLEPAMTIALAGIVLLVALSVFLPMWQLIGVNH